MAAAPDSPRRIALALGGLAGSNAFGAGALEAACDLGIRPHMISASSGQLAWVQAYVQRLRTGKKLRDVLIENIKLVERTGLRDLDAAMLTMTGVSGIFRPAWWEWPLDFMDNWVSTWTRLATGAQRHPSWFDAAARLMPARVLVPQFPQEFFDGIAADIAGSDVPIVFNSYSPRAGQQHVHLNDPARRLLAEGREGTRPYTPGTPSAHRPHTVYQGVDGDSVRAALWLYEYGFDRAEDFVDGAYYRQMILAELWPATDIVAVRPLANAWVGDLPRSFVGVQDLKTQVFFDGAYAAERSQISLVNDLLDRGDLAPGRYHRLELHEIQLRLRRDLLDYVFEDLAVFDAGYAQATSLLTRLANEGAGARSRLVR